VSILLLSNDADCLSLSGVILCHCSECMLVLDVLNAILLGVARLSVIMLSVTMQSHIMSLFMLSRYSECQ